MNFYDMLEKEYGIGEPIIINELIESHPCEKNIRSKISYLVKQGKVKRFDKEVIYIPKYIMVGELKLEAELFPYDVINAKYIKNLTIGYPCFHTLFYLCDLTDQLSLTYSTKTNGVFVKTNNIDNYREKIRVGGIEVHLSKSPILITDDNIYALMLTELMHYVFNIWDERHNPFVIKRIKDFKNKHNVKLEDIKEALNYYYVPEEMLDVIFNDKE